MGIVVVLAVIVGVVGLLIYFSRGRDRIMGYHDIKTPRVNESTHGAEGDGAA